MRFSIHPGLRATALSLALAATWSAPPHVLAGPVTAPGAAPPASATPAGREPELAEAVVHLQAQQWDRAEDAFRRLLQRVPQHPRALMGLGELAQQRGQPAEAGRHLQTAAQVAPQDLAVQLAWARWLVTQGRFAEAEPVFRAVPERHPLAYTAQRELGDLFLHGLKKPEPALRAYQRAAQLQPRAAAARFGIAMALLAQDKKDAALVELQAAAKLAPKDPALPHMAGRVLASQQQLKAAAQQFSQALALDPQFLPALSDRADVLAELRDDKAALADLTRLTQLQADNPTAWVKRGMVAQRSGRLDDARNSYTQALKLNDGLAVAHNNLASMALERQEPPAQALASAQRAVALAPQVPQFQSTLGWALWRSGQTGPALAALEKAAQLGPGLPEIQARLGELHEAMGQKAQAKAAYQKALASGSDFPQATAVRRRLAALP
jgi:tetratricopeptide (TPR) repeat protein